MIQSAFIIEALWSFKSLEL